MKTAFLIVSALIGLGASLLGYKVGLLVLLVLTIPLAMSFVIAQDKKLGLIGLALLNMALVACFINLPTH